MTAVKRAVISMSRHGLRNLLQLDDSYEIEAVYLDVRTETLVLVVSNAQFPETPEGKSLPELVILATEKRDDAGKVWVHLEPEGVRPYEAISGG